ncbi:MAG: Mrp/NBP35 family ATP-binding protein [Marinilabiliaceae bacterium]|nr:Mrp/NBP35 family ATP-binding protein [Marinilabiliaceae bacterium]
MEKITLPGIKNLIIVASGKGGVGKSTVAAGLALRLAMEGFKTGIMDGDIYGPSIPTLFNMGNQTPDYHQEEGKTRIVPFEKFGIKVMSIGFLVEPEKAILWRGPLASNGLKQILTDTAWGELDYLIVDTPPGTGDIHLTLLQQFTAKGVIMVTTPQAVAIADVQKAIAMFQDPHVGVPVMGVVENMAWFSPSAHPDEKYLLFGRGGGAKMAAQFNIPLLAQIPMSETMCETCDTGKLERLFEHPGVKAAFDQLVDGILNPRMLFKGSVKAANGKSFLLK